MLFLPLLKLRKGNSPWSLLVCWMLLELVLCVMLGCILVIEAEIVHRVGWRVRFWQPRENLKKEPALVSEKCYHHQYGVELISTGRIKMKDIVKWICLILLSFWEVIYCQNMLNISAFISYCFVTGRYSVRIFLTSSTNILKLGKSKKISLISINHFFQKSEVKFSSGWQQVLCLTAMEELIPILES